MTEIQQNHILAPYVGRTDVFAQQQDNGAYYPVTRPIQQEDLDAHLRGESSFGTYVLNADNKVWFAVFDLDTEDLDAEAELDLRVSNLLATTNSSEYVWEYSGGKGSHVWLFFDWPTDARKVRQWIAPFFADWPREYPLEIFPKQDEVREGGYGNLVKLPLGVHGVTGERSVVQNGDGYVLSNMRIDSSKLPEPPAREERSDEPQGLTAFPCIDACKEGVGAGMRDNAAYRLAVWYRQAGLDEDLALDQLSRDNENFMPPLEDWEVAQKLESAYRTDYRLGCDDFLQGICPGGDDCKARTGQSAAPAANATPRRVSYLSIPKEERQAYRASQR